MKYSKFMGKTLKERVEVLANDTKPMESLRDELSVTKALACDAFQLYEIASAIEDPVKRNDARLRAGSVIRELLNDIKDMAQAAVKVEKESRKALDVALIGNMANQFVGAIDDVLQRYSDQLGVDPQELADAMNDHIYNTVMLDLSTVGTSLTADQDVADMIASVPREPEAEALPALDHDQSSAESNGATNGKVHA